ncbi:TetR family transcriptional regulator [Gordonia asplenii]|nr:TetR family transcriptional regulator [Gordonia asplenii]
MSIEQRRDQLLDAALAIVVSDGHAAVTMGSVAARADVTRPVVYGVFADRAALLAALLDRESAAAAKQAADVVSGDVDAVLGADLPVFVERFLRAVHEAPARWFCIVMPVTGMPAEFHAARDAVRNRIVERIAAAVRRRARDADAQLVAEMIVGMLEWAARTTLAQPDDYPPERFAAAFAPVAALLEAVDA